MIEMVKNTICIQTGQCGNQIGHRFWDLLLKEFSNQSKSPVYTDALSSLFQNIDSRIGDILPPGSPLTALRARALLVDMEEGVVNSVLRSPIGELFESTQLVTDVSGSGNNWGHGYGYYGPLYEEAITDRMSRLAEECDSLQSFLLVNSLGGGTGSGLGSFILEILSDSFPSVTRFVSPLFPSVTDDVITSPYNSVLSLSRLKEFADVVVPLSNDGLGGIPVGRPESGKPFDSYNEIISTFWVNSFFSLGFDLSRISEYLIPFPTNHFLIPSVTPWTIPTKDVRLQARSFEKMFTDILSPNSQLLRVDPRQFPSLATGFLVRGRCDFSDVVRNFQKLNESILRPDPILSNSYLIRHSPATPSNSPFSLSTLNNSSAIREPIESMIRNFHRLFSRRAHIHHYTEYIELGMFEEAVGAAADQAVMYSHETVRANINRYRLE
jgi:tubulin epsilon